MKKTFLLTATTLALALPASAETRSFDYSGFDAIRVSSGLSVTYEAGDTTSITAEAASRDIDKLVIEMDGDTLIVRRKRQLGWGRTGPIEVSITAPTVEAVRASSGSSLTANGVGGDAVQIEASSGASLSVSNVSGTDVEIDASSGASLSASGTCTRVSIDGSSGSSISARGLECASVEADASSGSSISAHASERVVGEASSGASVSVSGGATDVTTEKSSGGSVSVG